MSSEAPDIAGKKLGLLREIVPGLRRLATLSDVGNPYAVKDVSQMREAGRSVGIEVVPFEVRRADEIAATFEALQRRAQALYVLGVPLLSANRVLINRLALDARLPTMHAVREYVKAGGLISYGPNWPDMWRRAAELVDKVLRGVKPADIPVEQPTKFELVINAKTAKALGITIPPTLLELADEVIE